MNENEVAFERGRRPKASTLICRQKVQEYITKHLYKFATFTVPDLAEKIEIDADEVRRALRFFEKHGIIAREGKKQTALNGGRPAVVWKVQ